MAPAPAAQRPITSCRTMTTGEEEGKGRERVEFSLGRRKDKGMCVAGGCLGGGV